MTENREKVVALTHREQAREKLSIFFGSRDNYFHPLRELIENGVDEIGTSHIELLLLTLFAGTKYSDNAGQTGQNGVGKTGLIAKEIGLKYTGIELVPEYVELTKERLEIN